MSNEVKRMVLRSWEMLFKSQPKQVFINALDQFEGMKLVKDEPIGYSSCFRCGKYVLGEGCLYHNIENGSLSVTERLCKSCFNKQCPETTAKPADVNQYDIRYQKPPEPAAKPTDGGHWKELRAAADREGYEPHMVAYRFEEAWKEQERRTSRMIVAAIKADRMALVKILDDAGYVGMAETIEEVSK